MPARDPRGAPGGFDARRRLPGVVSVAAGAASGEEVPNAVMASALDGCAADVRGAAGVVWGARGAVPGAVGGSGVDGGDDAAGGWGTAEDADEDTDGDEVGCGDIGILPGSPAGPRRPRAAQAPAAAATFRLDVASARPRSGSAAR